MHAVYTVSTQTPVFVREDTIRKYFSQSSFFLLVIGGKIEHGVRVRFQFFLHRSDKGIRRAFSNSWLIVRPADVDTHTGRSKLCSHGINPRLKPVCGDKQMIVFGWIEPLPGEDIGLACECSHIGRIQDTICIAVCQDLIVGQIVTGRLLVKQFPRICHGVDAGDLKLFHRLKQRFKRTVKLCVTIPEDFELVMAFTCQFPAGINHPHSIA